MPSNKEIKYTTKAKKDLKKYRNRPELLKELVWPVRGLHRPPAATPRQIFQAVNTHGDYKISYDKPSELHTFR